MIISINPEPNRNEFNLLLHSTINELNNHAQNKSKNIATLIGRNLEPYVRDVMTDLAVNTPFEGSIELIGGQKFPDIIANKYYGIEVKTTTQNHWKTTGNSVLESTRINDVERIFMLFAKLANPIEFRCRPYEEVLSEVVVTHSPRYLIDMNLEQGKTIFDKINIPYDTLRTLNNPITPIKSYYKTKLKEGDELWWMENENSNSIILRAWNNLNHIEKHELILKSMILFPQIFSTKIDKFGQLAMWLVQSESVVCPNVRDQFTAGGKKEALVNDISYGAMPRIFMNLWENIEQIKRLIIDTSAVELIHCWNIETSESTKYQNWKELVIQFSSQQQINNVNITKFLEKIL